MAAVKFPPSPRCLCTSDHNNFFVCDGLDSRPFACQRSETLLPAPPLRLAGGNTFLPAHFQTSYTIQCNKCEDGMIGDVTSPITQRPCVCDRCGPSTDAY